MTNEYTAKLWNLALHNSVVAAVMSNWKHGHYNTFEEALISAVLLLANINNKQSEKITELLTEASK